MKNQDLIEFYDLLMTNERGFHKLFCDLEKTEFYSLYHNRVFAEDPVFNHFILDEGLLSNPSTLEPSKIQKIVEEIKTLAKTNKLSTTIFMENFWPRSAQFEKAAIGQGYRVTDKMEILSKLVERDDSRLQTRSLLTGAEDRFEVEFTENLDTWNKIFMASYMIPQSWQVELLKREHEVLDRKSGQFVVARDRNRGNMNSGCLLIYSGPEEYLGIYCVGTIPEQRGKGVAREMLSFCEEYALNDQKKSFLTLQTLTSDNVAPMYKKLGYTTQFERDILFSPM